MADAPRGKAASTWIPPLPPPYPFVCSVSARAFPIHAHSDDSCGWQTSVQGTGRNQREVKAKNMGKCKTKTLPGVRYVDPGHT